MSIQYWSQGIILVNLPSQLQEHDELQEVMEMAHEQGACNVVVDFASVGDAMRDRVLAELFATTRDPIAVLKWKDIYQDAETVLDVCEDVAHAVDSIMVKQA